MRIAGFAQSHQRDSEFFRGGEFALGVFARADLHGAAGPAAPRQRRQCLQRGARAAEMIDQGLKGAGADIGAANKTQPVDPLLVG